MAENSSKIIEGDKLLKALISIMLRATERAENALDETLNYVIESNKRIAEMEAKKFDR